MEVGGREKERDGKKSRRWWRGACHLGVRRQKYRVESERLREGELFGGVGCSGPRVV